MDRLIWFKGAYPDNNSPFSLDREYGGYSIIPLFGKMGYLIPPISLITDKVPRQPGAILRERIIESRKVDIPLRIEADNYSSLIQAQRDLADALNDSRGTLRFVFGGESRELRDCTYVSGMMGSDGDSEQFIVWANMILTFEAHDPFFYDLGKKISYELSLTSSNIFNFFDSNFLDNMLSNTTIGDSFSAVNPGAAPAWGVWKITGPMNAGSSVNIYGGDGKTITGSFSFSRRIADGETITIDTRPTEKSVTSSATGDSAFSALSKNSNLFPIPIGTSTIKISVTEFNINTVIKFEADIPYLTL